MPTWTSHSYRLLVAVAVLSAGECWWFLSRVDLALADSLVLLAVAVATAVGVSAFGWAFLPVIRAARLRRAFTILVGVGSQLLSFWLLERAIEESSASPWQIALLVAFGVAFTELTGVVQSLVDVQRGRLAELNGLRQAIGESHLQFLQGTDFLRAELATSLNARLRELLAELRLFPAKATLPSRVGLFVDQRVDEISEGIAADRPPLTPVPINSAWFRLGLIPRASVGQVTNHWQWLLLIPLAAFAILPPERWLPALPEVVATVFVSSGVWWAFLKVAGNRVLRTSIAMTVAVLGVSALSAASVEWLVRYQSATDSFLLSFTIAFVTASEVALARALELGADAVEEQIAAAKLELAAAATLNRQQLWREVTHCREFLRDRVQPLLAAIAPQLETGATLASTMRSVESQVHKSSSAFFDSVAVPLDVKLNELKHRWQESCGFEWTLDAAAADCLADDLLGSACIAALAESATRVATQRRFARQVRLQVRLRQGLLLVDVVDDGVGLVAPKRPVADSDLFETLCLEWAIADTGNGTVLQATVPVAH